MENKTQLVLKLNKELKEIPTIIQADFKILLDNTKTLKNKDFFLAISLAFFSGLRLNEICGLKGKFKPLSKEDFLENKIITNYDRTVNFPSNWEAKYINYFPLKRKRSALQRRISFTCKRLGLKNYSFLSLRQGYLLEQLNKGYSLKFIKKSMGYDCKRNDELKVIRNL
ncbi:MAG TPA: hypothetical protein VMZ91_10375, partial [Candidatus Paceibacterota bacterium]|nr:hypothetical protein [Candidatus Paceibacterota bacterium]